MGKWHAVRIEAVNLGAFNGGTKWFVDLVDNLGGSNIRVCDSQDEARQVALETRLPLVSA